MNTILREVIDYEICLKMCINTCKYYISKIITKFKFLKFLWNQMANFTYISKIVDSICKKLKNANDILYMNLIF